MAAEPTHSISPTRRYTPSGPPAALTMSLTLRVLLKWFGSWRWRSRQKILDYFDTPKREAAARIADRVGPVDDPEITKRVEAFKDI